MSRCAVSRTSSAKRREMAGVALPAERIAHSSEVPNFDVRFTYHHTTFARTIESRSATRQAIDRLTSGERRSVKSK